MQQTLPKVKNEYPIFRGVTKHEDPREYVIALILAAKKAQVQKFVPKIKLFLAKEFLKTRAEFDWRAFEIISQLVVYIKSYKEKGLARHRRFFAGHLKRYRLI